MNHFEAHLMISSTEDTQDGNMVKLFLWEKGKMVNAMLKILDGFTISAFLMRLCQLRYFSFFGQGNFTIGLKVEINPIFR